MARIRISCSWLAMAACWWSKVAWMPAKRPSSQPTNWAWAMRSSDSVAAAAVNRKKMSASSWRKSSESTSCISASERSWISARRRLPGSSSGAWRISSSIARVIEAMRISLGACT